MSVGNMIMVDGDRGMLIDWERALITDREKAQISRERTVLIFPSFVLCEQLLTIPRVHGNSCQCEYSARQQLIMRYKMTWSL